MIEFLQISEMEMDMIKARTSFKVDYMLDNIFQKYPSTVTNAYETDAIFLKAETRLNLLSEGMKTVGLLARKVGKARK